MFNDERINRVCARVYCTGILLAVLYTVLFSVCRALVAGFYVRLYLTEITIILTGCMILGIDLLRWGLSRDEREEFERHRYYLTAGKVFVIMALLGYALSIPLRIRLMSDYTVNALVSHLLTLGCVYFFYTFKRHEVSFNYTFIDEPDSAYYRHVLRNIGVLAAVLLVPFGLAALLDLAMFGSFPHFLAILVGYILSTVELGVYYLILSILEKMNAREAGSEEETARRGLLRKGTMIAFLFCIGAQTVDVLLEVAYQWVIASFPWTQVRDVVMALSRATGEWSRLILVLVALAVSFLMEQYIHSKRVRIGVGGLLAVQAVWKFLSIADTAVIVCLERGLDRNHTQMVTSYTEFLSLRFFIGWLLVMAFACVMIYGLIRDCGADHRLWITLGIVGACQGIGLFLVAQSSLPAHAAVTGGGVLAASVLWLVLLRRGAKCGA